MRALEFLFGILLAMLPLGLKLPIYRKLFKYEIGADVRIGLTPLVRVKHCKIGSHVRIGHLNLFYAVAELEIHEHVHIGFLNLFRGGRRVCVERFSTILRQNTFNSILERDFVEPTDSILELGAGVFIAAGHWLDFSHRISIGAHTVIGGRNSSFWTHNRQRSRPIVVGTHCYLGSEIRVAPGVTVPPLTIVSLGSVLTGEYAPARSLIGGNPGRIMRPLEPHDLFLVARKTRNDIPDALAYADLPPDVQDALTNGAKGDAEHATIT